MNSSAAPTAILVILCTSTALAQQAVIDRCRETSSDADRIACLEAALLVKELQIEQPTEPAGIGAEQVIAKLREAEVLLAKGTKMPQVCRKLGVTEHTYYRWRKEYGGVRTDQIKRFKEVEKENARLKKIVADLTLDNAILKEAAYPNF